VTQNTQGSARPAGYSESQGRSMNKASSYDRKRTSRSRSRWINILLGT
jgi:hypothetical protein